MLEQQAFQLGSGIGLWTLGSRVEGLGFRVGVLSSGIGLHRVLGLVRFMKKPVYKI